MFSVPRLFSDPFYIGLMRVFLIHFESKDFRHCIRVELQEPRSRGFRLNKRDFDGQGDFLVPLHSPFPSVCACDRGFRDTCGTFFPDETFGDGLCVFRGDVGDQQQHNELPFG